MGFVRTTLGKALLTIGGFANLAVAALHIIIAFVGASAYKFFGAPVALTQLVQNNHTVLVVVIMGIITLAFVLAGLYGLSGAGLLRRLPGLGLVLLLIGVIYLLRGAVVFLMPFPNFVNKLMLSYPNILGMGRSIMLQDWVFSFVWLFLGLVYLVGWKFVDKR